MDCQRRSIGTVVGKWDTMAGPPTARRREVGVDVIFDADRNARRTYSKQALYLLVPASRATVGDFRKGSNTFRYYNCKP